MFLMDLPYVSDFLKESLLKHQIPVLKTKTALELGLNKNINFITEDNLIASFKAGKADLLYTNSENAINWIVKNLSFSELPEKINAFKDKVKFRELIKPLYPDFYFKEISIQKIDDLDLSNIPKPFIIKPSVGFFSLGVHKVFQESDWEKHKIEIKKEVENIKHVYPKEVLDISSFIVEENIEGEEYAFDAYYDQSGKPVILSILKHIFASGEDVYDRVYISSKRIIEENLEKFEFFLSQLGELVELKNFPLHVEVRVNAEGKLIPIEINPLRFGGWCTTADMTYFAFGFNPYEYLHKQARPDWKNILKDKEGKVFSNIVLNNSTGENVKDIKYFDYELLLSHFEKPLELRKADYKNFLIFGFLFAETRDENFQELDWILNSDLREFISL